MQKLELFFNLFLQKIQAFVSDYSNFYQIFVFLCVFVFSFVLAKVFLQTFKKSKVAKKHEKLLTTFNIIFFPFVTILVLAVAYLISVRFFSHSYVLLIFFKLCLLWLVIRVIKIFPNNNIFFTIISFSIISLAVLSILDVDQKLLTFQLGKFSISLYDFFKSLGLFCFFIWLFFQINRRVERFIHKQWNLPPNSKELLVKVCNIIIILVFSLVALNILGLDLTRFAFLTGAIGIGVGFGLKSILANFVSGFILLMDKTIEKGSVVEIEDISGIITSIGVRSTIVKSFDGKEILIPNEKFISDKVVNLTLSDRQIRFKAKIGVSYKSEPSEVKKILQEVLDKNSFVSMNPKPKVYLSEFGDSSVNFTVFFWVHDISGEIHQAREQVLLDIWQALKDNNIEIPYPQIDVHQR